MEKITVELIAHKEFSISSKGYNQAEVSCFEKFCKIFNELSVEQSLTHIISIFFIV